ncbi:MAG TPA: putative metalloprotease CJM1_0395 family protein [Holophagaceae bacterium]
MSPIAPAGLSGPAPSSAPGGQPGAAQAREIADLKARDQRVRAHEAAHLTAAGGLARGGASYTYERGPDGNAYAVGGEVSIDTSPVPGNPAATLAKAQRIQAAALAPADPSSQDRSVAAAAAAMATQAQRDLQRVQSGKASGRSLDVVA